MTPRHVRRLGVIVVIASLFVQLGAIGVSAAGPLEDKQAEAARVQRQLDAQAQRAQALDERFNQAQLKLDQADAAAATAAKAAQASEGRLADTKRRVRDFAVNAYVRGGTTPLIAQFSGSNGRDLPVRTAYINATTGNSRDDSRGIGRVG